MGKKMSIWLVFVLAIIFLLVLWLVNELPEENDVKEYGIGFGIMKSEVYNDEPFWLLDYLFEYNFKNNKGNLSFYLSKNNLSKPVNITSLTLSFSEETKKDLKIKNAELFMKGEKKEIINYKNSSIISLKEGEQLTNIISDQIKINFTFEKPLIPEGTFSFYFNDYNRISQNPKGNIKFYLGKKYFCEYPCIFGLEELEENKLNGKKEIILNFKQYGGEETYAKGDRKFKINTSWRSRKQLKNFLFSFIISVIAGLLVFSIEQFPKKWIIFLKNHLAFFSHKKI